MSTKPAPHSGIQLIGLDFDGTLLDPDDRVTTRVRKAIAAAQEAGILVIPVTGRPQRLVWDIADDVGLGPLAVCVNGAAVVDTASRRSVFEAGFSAVEAVRIIDAIRSSMPEVAFAAELGESMLIEPGLLEGLNIPERPGRVPYGDVRQQVSTSGCLKLIVRGPGLSSAEMEEAATASIQGIYAEDPDNEHELPELVRSHIPWVDIGPAGHTKGTGLLTACRELGVGIADTAVAGDHYNDLPMFAVAGLSAAMSSGVPEALAAAQIVIPANDKDGVGVFIEQILEGDFSR